MKPLAKTLTHALAALGLAGAAVSPAFAGTVEKMTVEVPYGDIDLATFEGQKMLDRRLEKASRTVCRITDGKSGTRIMSHEARACLAKVRSDTREQVAAVIEDQQRGG